jgi:hypothetical protein
MSYDQKVQIYGVCVCVCVFVCVCVCMCLYVFDGDGLFSTVLIVKEIPLLIFKPLYIISCLTWSSCVNQTDTGCARRIK